MDCGWRDGGRSAGCTLKHIEYASLNSFIDCCLDGWGEDGSGPFLVHGGRLFLGYQASNLGLEDTYLRSYVCSCFFHQPFPGCLPFQQCIDHWFQLVEVVIHLILQVPLDRNKKL